MHLSGIFREKQDVDGIRLCKQHDSEEGLRSYHPISAHALTPSKGSGVLYIP